jgi:hypothetical protein
MDRYLPDPLVTPLDISKLVGVTAANENDGYGRFAGGEFNNSGYLAAFECK